MYAQIKNGSITTFDSLPFRVTLADGTTRTSLSELSAAQLAAIGVYPVVGTAPEYDAGTQRLVGPTLALDGDHVNATWTVESLSAEEIAEILAATKSAKKAEIAAARWAEMSAPTVVEGYSATWYADKESQNDMLRSCIDMQTAISLGHLPPDTTTQWKTATGDFVVVGVNDLVTVRLLLSQRQQTMYTKEATLKAQIDAATTVAEVEAVVW